MPHVEVVGNRDLAGFHAQFQPRSLRGEDLVLKATGSFLARDGRSLLVDCLVAEGFLHQRFFILLACHGDRTMVRLLPQTAPERTEGVKRCIAWIALWFREQGSEARFGATNLGELLERPLPPEN